MSINEPSVSETEEQKRKAKRSVVIHTTVYVILFYVSFALTAFATYAFTDNIPIPFSMIVLLTALAPPVSIPISIYLMWSRYSRGDYEKTHTHAATPIFIFAVSVSLMIAYPYLYELLKSISPILRHY